MLHSVYHGRPDSHVRSLIEPSPSPMRQALDIISAGHSISSERSKSSSFSSSSSEGSGGSRSSSVTPDLPRQRSRSPCPTRPRSQSRSSPPSSPRRRSRSRHDLDLCLRDVTASAGFPPAAGARQKVSPHFEGGAGVDGTGTERAGAGGAPGRRGANRHAGRGAGARQEARRRQGGGGRAGDDRRHPDLPARGRHDQHESVKNNGVRDRTSQCGT